MKAVLKGPCWEDSHLVSSRSHHLPCSVRDVFQRVVHACSPCSRTIERGNINVLGRCHKHHDQKHLVESILLTDYSSHKGHSGWELKARPETETLEKCCLLVLLSVVCSVCFIIASRTNCPGNGTTHSGLGTSLLSINKKIPTDMTTGQSQGGDSLTRAPSSQVN